MSYHVIGMGKRIDDPFWKCRRLITTKGAQNPHEVILGGSGSGKSTSLYFRARQDIKLHRGFIAIDTHGDLFNQLLAELISQGWQPGEVAIINPADMRWGSPGIHLFEDVPGQHPYEVVAETLDAFHSLFSESTGYRMQDLLRRGFTALKEANLCLSEMERFLTDQTFRAAVVETLQDEEVKLFWQSLSQLRESEQRTWIEPPRNKLSAFLSHPAIKAIFSQSTSSIDFRNLMNTNRCCLINLSRNHLKQESRSLFGALILSRLVLAILSREDLPPVQRVPVTLYFDEAAEYFVPEFFLTIVTGARKFKAAMKLFSQSPSQFREHIDLLFANCAAITSFNCGDRKSAERMVKELFPLTGQYIKYQPENPKAYPLFYNLQEVQEHYIEQLLIQQPGECVIRIKGGKENGQPYLATVPKIDPPAIDHKTIEAFCKESATIFYRSQREIEEDRRKRLERFLFPPPPKKVINRS